MKKMKNAMLVLACGLFATVVTTTSCKKSSSGGGGGTAPTITTLTPNHGLVGATIVIAGTNLTGGTVKFGSVTASASSVTATSITCTVPAGAATGNVTVVTSAGTSNALAFTLDVVALPTSNDVAAADLIAHWTFDNTKAEAISGVVPTTGGTVTNNAAGGQIGGYASFTNGYLVYPTITALNVADKLAAGFTFTSWAKFPTTNNLNSLWQINAATQDIWGLVAFSFRHGASDSLDLDGTLTHVNGTGTHSTYGDLFAEGTYADFKTAPTAWAFIAMVYDTTGGTKKVKYYANGVLKRTENIATTTIGASEQFELMTTSSGVGAGLTQRQQVTFGTFNYTGTPSVFANGGGAPAGWQTSDFSGSVDDTRLFKRALTATEIANLYAYGSAGR
ncbi:IPT/TIG domain-containing protein [Ferruginibacter sp. SUN002]|uniref:IPT/TIG domain-containing protein n=1 Tax=Ferruginibacter sp. SUN002 TaxID=2937789 RepID=UPI003D36C57B